jgi:hypothetical protein
LDRQVLLDAGVEKFYAETGNHCTDSRAVSKREPIEENIEICKTSHGVWANGELIEIELGITVV